MNTSLNYEESLSITLLRAREAAMRCFKPVMDRRGLTPPQWRVIRALAEGGANDSKTLSKQCVILPPSLTRIFRTLGEKGLIKDSPATDARRHVVELTDAGQEISAELMDELEAVFDTLEGRYGPEKMKQMLIMLNEFTLVAQGYGQSAAAAEAAAKSSETVPVNRD